mgnify:CR=1 FL=1
MTVTVYAREVKKGQPVVYYNFTPKILVRADDSLSVIPGKIPFCEIGYIFGEQFTFHSIPVDVIFLPEDLLFDLVKCTVD